jgi:uncharacterized membrane protein YcaP (DUF421 family)
MLVPSVPVWELIVRTVVVYIVVLALLRVAGKRELGQMSVADLVVIIVIANAVQNSMNGGDNSLTGGIIAASTLVAMNLLVDRYASRLPFIGHYVREEPTLLMQDGVLLEKNMEQEHVDRQEIEMAARGHGLGDLSAVSEAVLEPDGSISIIPNQGGKVFRSSRRIRQLRQR